MDGWVDGDAANSTQVPYAAYFPVKNDANGTGSLYPAKNLECTLVAANKGAQLRYARGTPCFSEIAPVSSVQFTWISRSVPPSKSVFQNAPDSIPHPLALLRASWFLAQPRVGSLSSIERFSLDIVLKIVVVFIKAGVLLFVAV
ncbi:hypothetical protein [Paenibacillus sp. 1P07SE]|uniref:hypothetical protein n=1 Tax=Paenibacillus sp. 1P07SE TaxID=3132209 RepID=UPI0039A76B68